MVCKQLAEVWLGEDVPVPDEQVGVGLSEEPGDVR
jgi:hypothetical protein